MWIPNFLSGLRIGIAIVFPFLSPALQLPFVGLALVTEYLDGALARKFNWVTVVGQILDPVADKLFALSVGLTLIAANKLLLWQFLAVAFRDVTVTVGVLVFFLTSRDISRMTTLKPHFLGKLTTVFQYLVFFDALLLVKPLQWIIYATGILSLFSAIQYYVEFFNSASKKSRVII